MRCCDPWARVCFDNEPSTQSSSSSNVQDQRQAIGGSGIVAGGGSTVNFSISNPDGFTQLLATGAGVFEAALEFVSEENERAYALAGESTRSEVQHLGLQVLKSAGPILLVLGLGFAMMKGAK